MAKYQIATPGGYEVEVRADSQEQALEMAKKNWQTMPRIIAKQGDTRVFERPNGKRYVVSPGASFTDPERVNQVLQGMTAGEVARQGIDESIIAQNPVAARASQFVKGVPFAGSYVDEALGAVMGEDTAAGVRAMQGAMERQRPGETLGLNLAGGLTGSVAAIGAAPRALTGAGSAIVGGGSRLSRVGRAAGAGAALGGIEGGIFGAGEGTTASERLKSAGAGAGFGATFGGVLGAAGPVASDAVTNIIRQFKRSDISSISKELGVSKNAAKVIKNVFGKGGSVNDAVEAIRRAGSEGSLADANVASRVLLDAVQSSGARASDIVATNVGQRAARSGEALKDAMDYTLGFAEAPEALQRGVRKNTASSRQAAYDAAYGSAIDWRSPEGEKLDALLRTTPPEVFQKAQRLKSMAARADILPDYSEEFAPSVRIASEPTAEQVEVQSFFDRLSELERQSGKRRPLTDMIKKIGGVDPSGRAAEELRARGVTSRTHPGLFKIGGMKDLDNLEIDDFPESMRFGKDTGFYADPEEIISGLVDEGAGKAVRASTDQAVADELDMMQRLLPEYESRLEALSRQSGFPTAPEEVSQTFKVETVQDVDLVKRALDDVARSSEGQGLLGGKTAFGREAEARAKEIRDALVEAVPDYGKALETGADAIKRVEAIDIGRTLLSPKTTRDSIKEFVRGATGGELMAAKSGLRGEIDEIMANVRAVASDPNQDAREAMTAVNRMNTRAAKQKIETLLGDEAPDFIRQLEEASASMLMRADVARNSLTSLRGSVKEDVAEVMAPGVLQTAAKGEGVEAAKKITQAITGVTDEFTAEQRQRVFQELAQRLTQRGGPEAERAINVIDAAMRQQVLDDDEINQIAQILAVALYGGGTAATTRGASAEERFR